MIHRPWLTAALWMSLPTVINAPLLIDRGGTKIAGLAFLLGIMLLNAVVVPAMSIRKTKLLYRKKLEDHCDIGVLVMVAAMAILLTVSVFRALGVSFTFSNTFANAGLIVLTPLALAMSMVQAETRENRQFLMYAVLLALPVYVAANVTLFALGFSNQGSVAEAMVDERANQTLGLIGITATRVAFPLTSAVNGFGVVAAASALISFFLSLYSKGWIRFGAITLLPITLSAIILTDARGAALAAIMMGTATVIVLRFPKLLNFNFLLIGLTPFLPSLGYRFFEAANNGTVLAFMIRPGAQGARLGLGTGRGEIWKAILNFFSDFEPIHLIGYGAYGQITSHASRAYAWVFNDFGQTTASCHNTFLQYLLDTGYLGAALWLAFVTVLTLQARKALSIPDLPIASKALITCVPLLTVGLSQTEVFGTLYTPEILLLILSALVASAFLTPGAAISTSRQRARDKSARQRQFLPTMMAEREQSQA
jgi:hypothetical protein